MNYKQEAEKIVEIFYPFLIYQVPKVRHYYATKCAIKHVEGIIEELNELNKLLESHFSFVTISIQNHTQVLSQLKQM